MEIITYPQIQISPSISSQALYDLIVTTSGWQKTYTDISIAALNGVFLNYINEGTSSNASSPTIIGTAAEDINEGAAIYSDSTASGYYRNAFSNGVMAQADVIGIVTQAAGISTNLTGQVTLYGLVTYSGWAWTPGKSLFLDTISGGMTQVLPTTFGYYKKPLGFATTTSGILFYPMAVSLVSPSLTTGTTDPQTIGTPNNGDLWVNIN